MYINYEFLNELNDQDTSVICKNIIITEETISKCAGLLLHGKKK